MKVPPLHSLHRERKLGNILRNKKLQKRVLKMKHGKPNSVISRIFKEKCIGFKIRK